MLDIVVAHRERRWYRRKRLWLGGLLAVVVFGLMVPSTYSAGGIRLSVHYAGSPGILRFVVRDSFGSPLPGIPVMSESFSGTTGEFITDASGVALIRPGEAEVLAVRIDGREFRFRKRGSFLEHFAPDCSFRGLTFHVAITKSEGPL